MALPSANSEPSWKLSGPGWDQEHAGEADQEREPARPGDPLAEQEGGHQRGEQRRGEIDRHRARERHHAEGEQNEGLRQRLRHAAQRVCAELLRLEHRKAEPRQDEGGDADEADRAARKQDLADRIGDD